MSANLASNLTRTAAEHPDEIAVKLDDAAFNYGLLENASQRVSAMLKSKGVGVGDRVGIMLPNVPYFPAVYYGMLRAGAVVVPMNVLLKGREVGYYLSDPQVKVLFAWHGFMEAAEAGAEEAGGVEIVPVKPGEIEGLIFAHEPDPEVADCAGDDTAVILYTSGTTGKPKGAELTHDNLRNNVDIAVGLFDMGVGDVIFGGLPLFHSFGQTCTMNAAIACGANVTLLPRFDPGKALEILERDACTVFEGVPTMYGALLNHPDRKNFDVSKLRVCASGGASMPVEVLRGFEECFGCKVLEGYGLSETSPIASFNHPDRDRKPGSIGTPIRGVEFKLVDDDGNEVAQGEIGEILIKGHNVMKGYLNHPEATAESIKDGWFATRRHGQGRRGRLLLHRRSQEGPDHPRRLQRLPARGRGGALRASRRARGRGRRPAARRTRRGGRRGRRAEGRRRDARSTSCARSSRSRSPRTSTRARSGSSTSCRRGRRARSSSARSRLPT